MEGVPIRAYADTSDHGDAPQPAWAAAARAVLHATSAAAASAEKTPEELAEEAKRANAAVN